MQITAAGDSAVTLTSRYVPALASAIESDRPDWVIDYQVSFDKLTVIYDSLKVPTNSSDVLQSVFDYLKNVESSSRSSRVKTPTRTITIPVIYGGEHGPDLERIATLTKLNIDKIIAIHTSIEFEVAAVGFMPGFGYLTGLPKNLQIPRLDTPRTKVPAGSVGIGGLYTGVYPFASPGGWNLIGRTDLKMFDPGAEIKSIFEPGCRVRFEAVEER